MNNQPLEILKEYWGYDSFRPSQATIIHQALEGKDVIGLLPTGAGKSICYQIPALIKPGICIVISPLIALMNDQVVNLKKRGIKAEFISSGMSPKQMDYALDNCVYGGTKFLYLSPERLQTIFVKERLKQMKINFIAVDEAHCISQWGHDFRPAYRMVTQVREISPDSPVIAVTATATKKVANDIQLQLDFKKQNVVRNSFRRENIFLSTHHTENKTVAILHHIGTLKGSGIIYIRSRKTCEEITKKLNGKGISAEYYHAGIEVAERKNIETRWKANKTRIIVSTNAFGMGIDKPDVRFVIHYGLPNSLEEYYQEAGRSGRDGLPSSAALFFNRNDIQNIKNLVNYRFPNRKIIGDVYQSIANNAQVAIGAGENEGIPMDLKEFAKHLELHPLSIHYAIKILENAGYLFLSEDVTASSKLMILQDRREIERILSRSGFQSNLLSALLRSYTGLFNNHVKISEGHLSEVLQSSVNQVKKGLEILEKTNVIHYQQQNFLPKVFFAVPRVSSKNILIPKELLESRKEVALHQLNSLIEYAVKKEKCKSNSILFYFDETPKTNCGNCEICNYSEGNNSEKDTVFQLIKSHPQELAQLVTKSSLPRETTISLIRSLLDEGKIVRDGSILKAK